MPPRDPWAPLRARPLLCSAAGAVALGFAGIFFRLAEVSPTTAAFFRFVLALPFLAALAWRERSPGPAVSRAFVLPAGVLLAVDMVLWHFALEDVGAGLGTVLANTQVVFMVLLGWTLLGERLGRRGGAGIALVCAGVVLISGVFEAAPFGGHPVRGAILGVIAGVTSALYILALRHTNADARRPVRPLLATTVVGSLVAAAGGTAMGNLDLTPPAASLGWLLALAIVSQVLGWLLLSVPLRTLPATLTSVVLNLQPCAALVFAALLLGEAPTAPQLAGGAVTLVGLALAAGAARAGGREDEAAVAGG